jgi:hypothetical protein
VVTLLPPLIGFWGTFDVARGYFASIYLGVFLFWYILIQPKIACTGCPYYGKTCARGLGNLSAVLFRSAPGQEPRGVRLTKMFWVYWYAGVPLLGFAYLLLFRFSWFTAVFGAAFVATAFLSYVVGRNQCCAACLVRDTCYRSPFRDKT